MSANNALHIAVLGGDGIGPEVMAPALEILRKVEATTDLDAAKIAVTEAYTSRGDGTFPSTANSPVAPLASNAKYVQAVNYNSSASNVSVVVTLSMPGTSAIHGKWLGIFGTGQADGTVSWQCGTATGTGVTTVGSQTAMYSYLPAACQN